MATVRTSELLAKPRPHFERGFDDLDIWSVLVVQLEQHVIYRLVAAGRPKLTWKKLMEKDYRERKLTTLDP